MGDLGGKWAPSRTEYAGNRVPLATLQASPSKGPGSDDHGNHCIHSSMPVMAPSAGAGLNMVIEGPTR